MNKQLKADLTLLFITVIWGSTFILTKNALNDIPTLTFLALRFVTAFIVLGILLNRRLIKINRLSLRYGAIVGSLLCCGMLLQLVGLQYTTASKSAFITGLNVMFVPVFSAFILKKIPKLPAMLGVGLAFIGMCLLSTKSGSGINIGDFLTLLSAICFAFQIIFIDKFIQAEDPVILGVLQVGYVAIISTIVYFLFETRPTTYSPQVIIAILVTAIPATAIALLLQTVAQKHTSPTHTVLIFAAEPVFGAIFAYIIPNELGIREALSPQGIFGCALILIGMLVAEADAKQLAGILQKLKPTNSESETAPHYRT